MAATAAAAAGAEPGPSPSPPPPASSSLTGSTSSELGAYGSAQVGLIVVPSTLAAATATSSGASSSSSVPSAASLPATMAADPNLLAAPLPSPGVSRPSSPGVSAGGGSTALSRNTSTSTLPSLIAGPTVVPAQDLDPTALLLELDADLVDRHLDRFPQSQRPGAANEIYAVSHASHSRQAIDHVSAEDLPTFLCASCGVQLALQDELISKSFSGRDGKAYLFFSVLNCSQGNKEDRQLLTGMHTVADLSCSGCGRNVGWTYLRAWEGSQKYKEGKFILERAALHKANNWR